VLALDRLYTQTHAWPELTDILRKEIMFADNESEIAALQYRLGHVLETQLGDRKGAVEVYREILVKPPDAHRDGVGARTMFHAGHLQLEIAQVIEPLYESAGQFDKLPRDHEVELGKLAGPDRQGMYQRLAELAETKLFDQQRAFHWWSEAPRRGSAMDHALEESERLAGETGGWDDMVGAYTRALERTTDKDVKRLTLLRMARVFEFELHDPARAVETHLRALELEPKDADALPPRSIACTRTRGCTTTSPRSCAAASTSARTPTSSSSCISAAARSSRRARRSG